jgi:hypothetical protein
MNAYFLNNCKFEEFNLIIELDIVEEPNVLFGMLVNNDWGLEISFHLLD